MVRFNEDALKYIVPKLMDTMKLASHDDENKKVSPETVAEVAKLLTQVGYKDTNKTLFDALCRLGASELEETSKKGLLVKGNCGCGKTLGMKLLCKIFGWRMVSAREIQEVFASLANKGRNGGEEWDDYCVSGGGDAVSTIVVDDLGAERMFALYGVPCNPLVEFLETRYDKGFLRHNVRTMITTNLTDDQLKERYGERVMSRLGEMCVSVNVGGVSLRG